ncbi:hypothetical protein PCANC_22425 [Puccinia coronata f. sp. avenae]|uniref:Uncharacterized protein n=1 Tax=Puccinia coronata f. sp. avenae TaxID=200324 RepID=A0A2N5TL58_9BASI|nr:hypothetical protein PCANC_22425 [Puccinia coronata f. sp. avenae]
MRTADHQGISSPFVSAYFIKNSFDHYLVTRDSSYRDVSTTDIGDAFLTRLLRRCRYMEMNQAPGDASLTQSPRFRGPGIAWRREAPLALLALRGLRSPTESPPGGSPGPSVREAWLG